METKITEEERQSRLLAFKHGIAREFFTETADETYIVARWCFLNNLFNNFYWNSVHAIEKYLKAALLVNGHSAISNKSGKKYGHNIILLYQKVSEFASPYLLFDFKRPNIDFHWREESPESFITRLYGQGEPNNRYNLYGFNQSYEDIFKLDQIVFRIRNLSTSLESYIHFESKKHDRGFQKFSDLLSLAPNHNHRRGGTRFYKITEQGTPEAREAALKMNLPFTRNMPEFDHGSLRVGWASHNSYLYLRIFNFLEQLPSEEDFIAADLADWLCENIQFPPGDKDKIKDTALQLRKREVCVL